MALLCLIIRSFEGLSLSVVDLNTFVKCYTSTVVLLDKTGELCHEGFASVPAESRMWTVYPIRWQQKWTAGRVLHTRGITHRVLGFLASLKKYIL